MMILAPALAFVTSYSLDKGFLAYEKTTLFFIGLSPLLARGVAQVSLVPLGWLCMMMLLGLILRKSLTQPTSLCAEKARGRENS